MAKPNGTKITAIETSLTSYAKKADVATDITAIKNDYVTNVSLTSQLSDLKSQHMANEITTIDNKTQKNASDILALESKLQQKKDTINENERGNSFTRGLFFYIDQSYLVYDCKLGSFNFTGGKITTWKSTGIFNYLSNSNMNAVADSGEDLPALKNDGRLHVYLSGIHFQQNKVIILNNNYVINIYCVYQMEPRANSRLSNFTVQNALFGAIQITKNTDTSKYECKGYGICFDEGGMFSK